MKRSETMKRSLLLSFRQKRSGHLVLTRKSGRERKGKGKRKKEKVPPETHLLYQTTLDMHGVRFVTKDLEVTGSDLAGSDGGVSHDADCASDAGLRERRANLASRRLTIVAFVLSGCIICGAGPLIAPMALNAMLGRSILTPPPIIVVDLPSAASPLPSPPSLPEANPSLAAAASPPAAPPRIRWPAQVMSSRTPLAQSLPVPSSPPLAPSTLSIRTPLWPGTPPPPSSPTLSPVVHVNRRAVNDKNPPTPAPRQVPSPSPRWHQASSLPIPTLQLIAHLNRRFVTGAPSNSLSEAGVLMHVLDGYENSDMPWSFNPSNPAGDRTSASVVSARHPDIYEDLRRPIGHQRWPGFVLASAPVQERLSCAYCGDIGTARQRCDHLDPECRPGCTLPWCEGSTDWPKCTFPPWRLKEMLELFDSRMTPGHHPHWGYNEVCTCVCWWREGAGKVDGGREGGLRCEKVPWRFGLSRGRRTLSCLPLT